MSGAKPRGGVGRGDFPGRAGLESFNGKPGRAGRGQKKEGRAFARPSPLRACRYLRAAPAVAVALPFAVAVTRAAPSPANRTRAARNSAGLKAASPGRVPKAL